MGIKRQLGKTLQSIGSGAEDVGKYIGHAAKGTAGSVGHTVENTVDRVADHARTTIEHKVERTIEQAQDKLYEEIGKVTPGAIRLGIGLTTATVSGLLLSIGVVQLLIEVVHLPSWAAYLIVGGIFAIVSFIFVQQGRSRLFSQR